MDLSGALITPHAAQRMQRREIREADVRRILEQPEQVQEVRPGRVVAQGMIGHYLLRVFVDVDRLPPEVVTTYRTSRIGKYRGET